MRLYRCKIGMSDGRVLEKDFEAVSRVALKENLEGQGFYVFRIRRAPLHLLLGSGPAAGRLNSRRFLALNQEMLVLIKSGLPILQVLDTLIDRAETGALLEALRDVRSDVRGGSSLSEAF